MFVSVFSLAAPCRLLLSVLVSPLKKIWSDCFFLSYLMVHLQKHLFPPLLAWAIVFGHSTLPPPPDVADTCYLFRKALLKFPSIAKMFSCLRKQVQNHPLPPRIQNWLGILWLLASVYVTSNFTLSSASQDYQSKYVSGLLKIL